MKLMECTRGISPVIRHRMVACGCPNNWRLHSSMLSKSEHRSQFSAERHERTNTTHTVCRRIEECSRGSADQWIRDFNRNTIRAILIPGGIDFDSAGRPHSTFEGSVESKQHRTADHLASFGCSAFQTGPQIGGARGKENRLEGGCEFCLRTQPFENAGRASVIAVLELRHPAAVKRRQVRFGRSAWLLREEIAIRKKPPRRREQEAAVGRVPEHEREFTNRHAA